MLFSQKSDMLIEKDGQYKAGETIIIGADEYVVVKYSKRNIYWVARNYFKDFVDSERGYYNFVGILEKEFGQILGSGYGVYLYTLTPRKYIEKLGYDDSKIYYITDVPNQNKHQIDGILNDLFEYYDLNADSFDSEKLVVYTDEVREIKIITKTFDKLDEFEGKLQKLAVDFGMHIDIKTITSEKIKECKQDFMAIKKARHDPMLKMKERIPKILDYLENHDGDVLFADLRKDLGLTETILRKYFTKDPLKGRYELVLVNFRTVIKRR